MNILSKIGFAAVVLSGALAAASASAQTIKLKMAHQWPDDKADYVVAAGKKFAEEVAKASNNQIQIDIFPAESLVKALNTHTALKNGAVDLAIYPYIYAAGAIPEMNLILLPGMWKTHEDVFRFRTSEPWKKLEQKAEQYGFKTLSWIQISGGVASTAKPIVLPADLQGMKARGAGKMMEAALQAAGASTVSMSSTETYNAMQLGLLNAVWTSSGTFGAFRLYEVSKYYTSPEDYSVYFTIEPIAISMKAWNKLSPAQQKILTDVGKSLEQASFEAAKKDDQRVAKLFADAGAKVSKMTLPEWTQWQTLFKSTSFEKFRKDVPNGAELLDQSLAIYK